VTLLTFEDAFDRLEMLNCEPHPAGQSRAYARCPSHDDHEPSLSIAEGDTAELVITCFAGCSFDQVLARLNGGRVIPTDRERVTRARSRKPYRLVPQASYPYESYTPGVTLTKYRGQLIEVETGEVKREKAFLWTHTLPDGIERRGADGHTPALYQHDAIAVAQKNAEPLYLTEGEKDADSLAGKGIPAVSVAHGADTWLPEWTTELAGLTVPLIICADDDEHGHQHAQTVASELADLNVQIVLPAAGKDISDHLTAGRGLDELREIEVTGKPAKYVALSRVPESKFRWAWRGYLPYGALVVIEGDGGLGKSTVVTDLAARCSTTGVMPDGTEGPRGAALILSREDDIASVVRGRVRVAGGDLARVYVGNPEDFGGTRLPDDITDVEKFIVGHGVVLLGLDPWVSFLRPGLDYHNEQDVRVALTPLIEMAARTGVTVLLVRHWRKGGGKANERGLGSISITNVVRMVLPVVADPDSPGQFVLSSGKANYVAGGVAAMPYRIVGSDPDDPATAQIAWQAPDSTRVLADLIVEDDEEHRTQADECADWLDAYLRGNGFRAERKAIMKESRADGFTWSEKVWRNACTKLDIDTHERTNTARPGTIWKLDEAAAPRPNRSRRAVTPPPVPPSPIYPQGVTGGTTDGAQQASGAKAPENTSPALPIDVGRGRG
jgi:hypothetical protein